MTFGDIYKHLGWLIIFSWGCWAPEVAPTSPKKSPAEIAGMAIPSAQASPPVTKPLRPQELHPPAETVEQNDDIDDTNSAETFPFWAKLTMSSAKILGHGGGVILEISQTDLKTAQLQVLEKKDDYYRVLCQQCTTTHPFQAGWIHYSEVTSRD